MSPKEVLNFTYKTIIWKDLFASLASSKESEFVLEWMRTKKKDKQSEGGDRRIDRRLFSTTCFRDGCVSAYPM